MGNSAEFKKRPLSLVPPPAAGEVVVEGCASEGVVMPSEVRPPVKAVRQRSAGKNIFERAREVTRWTQLRIIVEIEARTGIYVGETTWRRWESGVGRKCDVDVVEALFEIIAEHESPTRRAG